MSAHRRSVIGQLASRSGRRERHLWFTRRELAHFVCRIHGTWNQAPDGPATPARLAGLRCTSYQVTSIPSAPRMDERPCAAAHSVSHDWRLTGLCTHCTAPGIHADCFILALLIKIFADFLDPLRECARPSRTPRRRGGAFGDVSSLHECGLAT